MIQYLNAVNVMIGLLTTTTAYQLFKMAARGVNMWRTGATTKERNVVEATARQRDEALDEVDLLRVENDQLRRMVARRDRTLILANKDIPDDGGDTPAAPPPRVPRRTRKPPRKKP